MDAENGIEYARMKASQNTMANINDDRFMNRGSDSTVSFAQLATYFKEKEDQDVAAFLENRDRQPANEDRFTNMFGGDRPSFPSAFSRRDNRPREKNRYHNEREQREKEQREKERREKESAEFNEFAKKHGYLVDAQGLVFDKPPIN
jgi:hypothetical protein